MLSKPLIIILHIVLCHCEIINTHYVMNHIILHPNYGSVAKTNDFTAYGQLLSCLYRRLLFTISEDTAYYFIYYVPISVTTTIINEIIKQ